MYYNSITDKYGNTHSIDNVIIDFDIAGIGSNGIETITGNIKALANRYTDLEYIEKLGLNPSRKYSFCVNFIHLDNGISVFIGKQTLLDREEHRVLILPIVRLKVNLNKHSDKPILKELVKLLNGAAADKPRLNKYDYAIDIPASSDDIVVFGSRKEKGLYKGTRYYGQRGKDGFCKIYDKAKEQGLEEPLTRVEHTFSTVKHTKELSLEKVYIKSNKVENIGKMTPTDKAIIDLIKLAQANDLNIDEILDKLDSRKKRDIFEKLGNCGYTPLKYSQDILDQLLADTLDYFNEEEEFKLIEEYEEVPFD